MTSLLWTRANRQFSHQCKRKKKKKKKLLPVWRLAVTSWSAINPVELDPSGAITVVFLRYNNKPEKSKRKTSMIHRQYYSPKVGEKLPLKTLSILNILVGVCPLCAGTEDNERQWLKRVCVGMCVCVCVCVCVWVNKTPAASDNTRQAGRISWEATDFILASRTRECVSLSACVCVCGALRYVCDVK